MNRPVVAALTASAAAATACGAPPQAEIGTPPSTAPQPPLNTDAFSKSITPTSSSTTVTIRSQVVPQSASTFTLPEDEGREQTDAEWAIRSAFGSAGNAAVKVATCESTLNPEAQNGDHAGLFQLSRRWHEARANRLGYTWAQMYEVLPNVAVAFDLYSEQGWEPWTCRAA